MRGVIRASTSGASTKHNSIEDSKGRSEDGTVLIRSDKLEVRSLMDTFVVGSSAYCRPDSRTSARNKPKRTKLVSIGPKKKQTISASHPVFGHRVCTNATHQGLPLRRTGPNQCQPHTHHDRLCHDRVIAWTLCWVVDYRTQCYGPITDQCRLCGVVSQRLSSRQCQHTRRSLAPDHRIEWDSSFFLVSFHGNLHSCRERRMVC